MTDRKAYFVLPAGLNDQSAALVLGFAAALADKLQEAQEKYGYADEWRTKDWETECRHDLLGHVMKGDPLDVAAYAAFCWFHGWPSYPDPDAAEKFATKASKT